MRLHERFATALVALLLAVCPLAASATTDAFSSAAGVEPTEIKIHVNGSSVRVMNAAKNTMFVYNLAGACISAHNIESEDRTIQLGLPKGIYILKVATIARKVNLR